MERSEIQASVFTPDSAEPVLSEVEGLHLGYVLLFTHNPQSISPDPR